MKEEDLGTRSVPRNPLLFSMLYRMRLVEHRQRHQADSRSLSGLWGSGTGIPGVFRLAHCALPAPGRGPSPPCDSASRKARRGFAGGDEPGRPDGRPRLKGPQTLFESLPATRRRRRLGRDDPPRQSEKQDPAIPANRPRHTGEGLPFGYQG